MTAVESFRTLKKTQSGEGSGSLSAQQDHSMAVTCGFTECGVFHSPVPSQVD